MNGRMWTNTTFGTWEGGDTGTLLHTACRTLVLVFSQASSTFSTVKEMNGTIQMEAPTKQNLCQGITTRMRMSMSVHFKPTGPGQKLHYKCNKRGCNSGTLPTDTMLKELPFSMCRAQGQTWSTECEPLLQGPNLPWESEHYIMSTERVRLPYSDS